MRCHAALQRIASLAETGHLPRDPELARHIAACPKCAEAWREHGALLLSLASPPELPEFSDLVPKILARLGAPPAHKPRWEWAAAVALAVAGLALGYLFGQISAGPSPAGDSMAATYQAAFTGQPASSAELAYLEAGSRTVGGAPGRSAP